MPRVTSALKKHVQNYLELSRQKKEIDDQMQTIKGFIVGKMGDEEQMLIDGHNVTNSHFLKNQFDTKAFQKAHKNIYEKFCKQVSASKFQIT